LIVGVSTILNGIEIVCLFIRVPCVERFWGLMPYFKKMEMFLNNVWRYAELQDER
jgi:hypothetical protein